MRLKKVSCKCPPCLSYVSHLAALFETGWHLSLKAHDSKGPVSLDPVNSVNNGAERRLTCLLGLKSAGGAVSRKSVGFVWVAHRLGAPSRHKTREKITGRAAPCWLRWMAVQGQSLCLLGSIVGNVGLWHSLHGLIDPFSLPLQFLFSFVNFPSSTTCAFSHT